MTELDEATFDEAIAGEPLLVDFWAPWCRPCKALEPILEELEREADGVAFAKLDIDASPETAARYDVLSIPTVIVFAGGEPRETVVGARSRKHFERALARWLA